jgi:energy-coupling factor transporter transmembrane protein EcfT
MKSYRKQNFFVSFLDKLDPRTKIISTLFLTVYTFFIRDAYQVYAMLLLLVFLFIIGRINLFNFIKNYKISILFAIGIFIFHTIWSMKNFQNLNTSIFISSRIIIIIMTANVLFAVTSLEELGEGIKILFKVLKFKQFDINDFVFMIGFSLRFMPILFKRIKIIRKSNKHKQISNTNFIKLLFDYLKKYENKMVFFIKKNSLNKKHKDFIFTWRDYTVFVFIPVFFVFIINLK